MGGSPDSAEPIAPRRVLPLLLIAYATFYLCRANVEPALNLLAIERGYDNEQIGLVLGIALGAYAVGKLVLGPMSDVKGGKTILVASLFATVGACMAVALVDAPAHFGKAMALVITGVFVIANRFVQAGGWGGLVNVVAQFFGPKRRGTVMGILSTSYDVGNVSALMLSAALVNAGYGWRALFLVPPAIVLVVAFVIKLFLPARGSIQAAVADDKDAAPKEPVGAIAMRLAKAPSFWFAFGLSFLLTFVRAGFMTWTPRFLYEVSVAAHETSATSGSIAKSAFFGVAGIIGSVVTGRLSDRLGPGRRASLVTSSLALLVVCILALAHAGVSSPLVATAGVASCGLFLLGPFSLLSGAVAIDVAGPRGASTAAGFIDAIGYVGASLAAIILGSVSKRAGWTAAFDVVAIVAFLALALSALWSMRSGPGVKTLSRAA